MCAGDAAGCVELMRPTVDVARRGARRANPTGIMVNGSGVNNRVATKEMCVHAAGPPTAAQGPAKFSRHAVARWTRTLTDEKTDRKGSAHLA